MRTWEEKALLELKTGPVLMNGRELLVDCLRRLNRTGVTYYLTGSYLRGWAMELDLTEELERL